MCALRTMDGSWALCTRCRGRERRSVRTTSISLIWTGALMCRSARKITARTLTEGRALGAFSCTLSPAVSAAVGCNRPPVLCGYFFFPCVFPSPRRGAPLVFLFSPPRRAAVGIAFFWSSVTAFAFLGRVGRGVQAVAGACSLGREAGYRGRSNGKLGWRARILSVSTL